MHFVSEKKESFTLSTSKVHLRYYFQDS